MIKAILRSVGHFVPDIHYVRAIPNRILKPLHIAFGLGEGVVNVLGFKMRLNPVECVDGWLWFAPHLYDHTEINYLLRKFPQHGTFLDVGANIGFWSLRFANTYPNARMYAIEANPMTFQVLAENIQINSFNNIAALNIGVSDECGALPLYCNDTGNRGGDSFSSYAAGRSKAVMVSVKPLAAIINDASISSIDVMKIDIEGFEERALRLFFEEAPRSLWPHYICAEILHVPEVVSLLQCRGYQLVLVARENSVFELVQPLEQPVG